MEIEIWVFRSSPGCASPQVTCIKELTEGAIMCILERSKPAWASGNIKVDLAAKKVVTHRIIDSGVDRNDVSERDLDEAGIECTCSVSSNADESHDWPVHPAPGSIQ